MRRWERLAFLAPILLAWAVHLRPWLSFAVWGSDSGEYHILTRSLATEGTLPARYLGWGRTYHEFPGFYIAPALMDLLGIPTVDALALVAIATGIVATLLIATITLHITRDSMMAMVAALIPSAILLFVYPQSHPIPGSLGVTLLLVMVLLTIIPSTTRAPSILLLLTTVALALTHHLSLLIALIAVGILAGSLHFQTPAHIRDMRQTVVGRLLPLTIGGLIGTFLWLTSAPVFATAILGDRWYLALLLPLAPVGGLVWGRIATGIIPSYTPSRNEDDKLDRPTFLLAIPPQRPSLRLILALVPGFLGILALTATPVPGTSVTLPLIAVPLLGISLLLLGPAILAIRARPLDTTLRALLEATLLVALMGMIGALVAPEQVILYRFPQYLVPLVSILAGVGIIWGISGMSWARPRPNLPPIRPLAISLAIAALIIAGAATAYPPQDLAFGFEEGTTDDELAAILWLRDGSNETTSTATTGSASSESSFSSLFGTSPSSSLLPGTSRYDAVATDHRLSSMAFGIAGVPAAWDTTRTVWEGPIEDRIIAAEQMEDPYGNPLPADVALYSSVFADGYAQLQYEEAVPLPDDALSTFIEAGYPVLYTNGNTSVVSLIPL